MEKPCRVLLLCRRLPLLEFHLVIRNLWKKKIARTNFGEDFQFIGGTPQQALLQEQCSFLSWCRLGLMDNLDNPGTNVSGDPV